MLSHCTCLLIGWGVPLLIMAVWTGARIIKRTPSVHNTAQSASEDYYFQTGPLSLVEDRRNCAVIGWIMVLLCPYSIRTSSQTLRGPVCYLFVDREFFYFLSWLKTFINHMMVIVMVITNYYSLPPSPPDLTRWPRYSLLRETLNNRTVSLINKNWYDSLIRDKKVDKGDKKNFLVFNKIYLNLL